MINPRVSAPFFFLVAVLVLGVARNSVAAEQKEIPTNALSRFMATDAEIEEAHKRIPKLQPGLTSREVFTNLGLARVQANAMASGAQERWHLNFGLHKQHTLVVVVVPPGKAVEVFCRDGRTTHAKWVRSSP
jgi:hypothetical protein